MRPDHPLAKAQLTLEDFIAADHLLVSVTGDVTGPTDQVLANMGLKRRIAMSVNQFYNATPLLKESNLICVAPSLVVEKEIFSGELAVFETPVEIKGLPMSVMWHQISSINLNHVDASVSPVIRKLVLYQYIRPSRGNTP